MRSIIRIMGTARELWPLYIGIIVGAVLTSATALLTPFVIARATDTVVSMVRPDGGGDPGRGSERDTDTLPEEQRRVHDAIPRRGLVTVDEIAYAAGLGVPAVRSALASMEIAGLVCGAGGGWRLARS